MTHLKNCTEGVLVDLKHVEKLDLHSPELSLPLYFPASPSLPPLSLPLIIQFSDSSSVCARCTLL
eukprot:700394-Hanusia_phi.AAC.1